MKFRDWICVSSLHSSLWSVTALFFILISSINPSMETEDERFTVCSQPFDCGNLKNLSFPFWGGNRPKYCGHESYGLNCYGIDDKRPVLEIYDREFHVLRINQFGNPPNMTLSRRQYSGTGTELCPAILDYTLFRPLNGTIVNITLFRGCTEFENASQIISCSANGQLGFTFFVGNRETVPKNCRDRVVVPIEKESLEGLNSGDISLRTALSREIDVQYNFDFGDYCLKCKESGGNCGSSQTRSQFACYCDDGQHDVECGNSGNFAEEKLIIAVSTIGVGVALAAVILRMKRKSIRKIRVFRKVTKSERDIETIIRNYGTLAPKRYSCSDVKKMTKSYGEKLGQGGYGDVYKGNLLDGQRVAVKVLKESKGNGEEFINEVASISKTSHVNIVTLVGFCLEGDKRALIYEFMPNGSLEKFIFKENTTLEEENKQILGWEKLFQIALGIARGLEYLHHGCNTRILHLDIKPQNILLDEEFCPKISDFGLSKLCTRKDSVVSMLEARGTIGYIAPEIFSRNFGVVSTKSDIYSYGMMVLEMAGGKKSNKTEIGASSEYFPDWIYKDLNVLEELELKGLRSNNAETNIGKKMILVGLWCIQTKPSDRPSINKVIEMLEGSVEALPIPPKPFLSSPPRLVSDSFATSSSDDTVSLVE